MQDRPSFGIVELEEMSEDGGQRAEEREVSKLLKVKPTTLADFNRDYRKGHAFFNTCCIYFAIVRDLFPNDQACIHWVLSFSNWIMRPTLQTRYSNTRQRARGTTSETGTHLKKMFSDQFCPKNEQLMALTRLEGTSWYQAKDLVDDYIDCFQELIDLVEYDDNKTIIIKF